MIFEVRATSVDATYLRGRLAALGGVMASVALFLLAAEILISGLGVLQTINFWVSVGFFVSWAALWAACRFFEIQGRGLRAVEAICVFVAAAALAAVARLAVVENFRIYEGPLIGNVDGLAAAIESAYRESSQAVLLAMALAMTARAALVPTSPTYTAEITGLAGVPLVLIWLVDISLLEIWPARPATPPTNVAVVATLWWAVSTTVCYVISRVVHGLRVDVLAARKMGPYTLGERLGAGGMGEVYRATHSRLRRPTAIKLLPSERSSEAEMARFETEVQLTAELSHPNTIRIYDYGHTEDGVFYYVMEHLDGATLTEIVAADGRQSPARVLRILIQVAGALQEAHEKGRVHRDIKPSNIMLARQGVDLDTAKVLDFGLVQAVDRNGEGQSQDGAARGTPQYMAPEIVRSASAVSSSSDLYALGAVGYFLLSGEHVFSAASVVENISHQLHTEPEPLSQRVGEPMPSDLEAVIMACLAKQPEDRPADAEALLSQLRGCRDYGVWTHEDARRWWEQHRPAIENGRCRETGSSSQQVSVVPARENS